MAPLAPYWSVLWRSGLALARDIEQEPVAGMRVVELGCGLGVPSLAAARAGATVLATEGCPEALALLARNARSERADSAPLLSLLPRLAREAWIADPGRSALPFLEEAARRWPVRTRIRDVVTIHRLTCG